MFDKSFNRSKNYFVALQLLRIIEEWIEEILPSIEQLREDRRFKNPIFFSSEGSKNLDAADRFIKERGFAVLRRVRNKTAEINSLRDGVCFLHFDRYNDVTNLGTCSYSMQRLFVRLLKQWH